MVVVVVVIVIATCACVFGICFIVSRARGRPDVSRRRLDCRHWSLVWLQGGTRTRNGALHFSKKINRKSLRVFIPPGLIFVFFIFCFLCALFFPGGLGAYKPLAHRYRTTTTNLPRPPPAPPPPALPTASPPQ